MPRISDLWMGSPADRNPARRTRAADPVAHRAISGLLVLLLALVGIADARADDASAQDSAALTQAMCALQDRYIAVHGFPTPWPAGPSGEPTPPYPSPGWYDGPPSHGGNSTQDPTFVVSMVESLAMQTAGLSSAFLDSANGNFEGVTSFLSLSSQLGGLPPANNATVTPDTYAQYFSAICALINQMQYMPVGAYLNQTAASFSDGAWAAASGWWNLQPPPPYSPDQAYSMAVDLYNKSPKEGGGWSGNWVAWSFMERGPDWFGQATYNASVENSHLTISTDLSRFKSGSATVYLALKQMEGATEPLAGPVPLDNAFHALSSATPGGVWTSEELYSGIPPQPPTPAAVDDSTGMGCVVSGAEVVYNGHFRPAPSGIGPLPKTRPNPQCPTDSSGVTAGGTSPGADGGTSTGNSVVDNTQLGHIHSAVDYASGTPTGGCSACGASAPNAANPLPSLQITRIHRYHDIDRRGSFGPGVFSSYDVCLTLCAADNSIEVWDPQARYAIDMADPSATGTYNDIARQSIAGLVLHDGNNAVTGDQTQAVSAVLTTGSGMTYAFAIFPVEAGATTSFAGRLTAITDRNGNATTIAYQDPVTASDADLGNDRGRLWRMASITDAYGQSATLSYGVVNGLWVIQGIALPNGSALTYAYGTDALIGVTGIAYPDGTTSTFSTGYDADDQWQYVHYEDAGAADIHRRKTVYLTTCSVAGFDGRTRIPQAPDHVCQVVNGAGEISYRCWLRGMGAMKTLYVYEGGTGANSPGTMLALQTNDGVPTGSLRATSFDLSQDPSTYAWQTISTTGTDAAARPTVVTDAMGRSTRYQYTSTGAVTQRVLIQADGVTVYGQESTSYNAFREPLSSSDMLGRITQYTYDAQGNQLTKTVAWNQPEASTWSWTYNTRGQPLTATDANGNVTTYIYDENPQDTGYRRLIAVVEPKDYPSDTQQATRTFTYDAAGRLLTSTDASGRTATYAYDARNRVSSIQYADGSRESFAYGNTSLTANLLVQRLDRNGNVTALGYDGAGRKTSESIAPPAGTPVIGTTSWSYLQGKQLVASMSDNGNTTTYSYDYQLRQIAASRQPTATTTLTISTVYDGTQRVAYTQDAYGRRTYFAYDRNDNPTRTVQELVPGAIVLPAGYDSSNFFLGTLPRVLTANPPYRIVDKEFDQAGQLIAQIDGRGFRQTNEYDHQGRLTATVSSSTNARFDPLPDNTVIVMGYVWDPNTGMYDIGPQPIFLGYAPPDPRWMRTEAARTAYLYDAQGNRTSIIYPRAFARVIPPIDESQGIPVWHIDPYSYLTMPVDSSFILSDGSFATTSAYTGRNLLASQTEAPGSAIAATTTFTYTPTRKIATQTDARNPAWVTTSIYYQCCDRLYQQIDPLGQATTYAYDPNGNTTSVRDPNGVGGDSTFDARNRELTRTNTLGETTTMVYDDNLTDGSGIETAIPAAVAGLAIGPGAACSAVATTNAVGETTVAVRDGIGRPFRSLDGNGNATTMGYDTMLANGLIATTQTDALGHTVEVHADGANAARERRDAEGNLSVFGFDPSGNQLTASDPNGVGWAIADDASAVPGLDGRGEALLRTDTHGDAMGYAYDLAGNVVTATDALGHATTTTYDDRNRKTAVLDRVGGTTTYAYDADGNLISITDAEGGQTVYSYDARNQLAAEAVPPNAAHQSTVRTYTYDNGKRLQSRTVGTSPAAMPPLAEVTTYGYDAANRLLQRSYSDGQGNDSFAYDHAGRMISAISGRYGIAIARSYTGNAPPEQGGRLTGETVAITGCNPGVYVTAYQYDAANRVVNLTYPSGDHVTRNYTARNQLSSVLFDQRAVATRSYDAGGRLTTTVLGNGLTEARGYRSDADGNDDVMTSLAMAGATNYTYQADASKRTTSEIDGQIPALSQQFSAYDQENRLTGWSRNDGSTQTWSLSPVGDWTQTAINGAVQTRTSDPVHEVTSISTAATQPTYDFKGNLTANINGAIYSWDSENHLVSATIVDPASGATGMAVYRYDALGRRIQKTAFRTTTTFIHDGAQVIDEFDAPATRPVAAANQHGSGMGQPAGGDPLADQGTNVTRIAAQPWSTPIPPGFMGEFGQPYALLDNSQTYGWSSDQSANAVTRGIEIALPQFDSFIQFGTQAPSAAATWSIGNLQPGTYAVIAVFGDAASTNQTNDVSIQGISEIDQSPAQPDDSGYPLGNFDGYAETVTVTAMGTITIGALPTAFNPKLCFVEIGPVGSSITAADRANLANLVAQANAATQQTQAIQKKHPSPRLYAYGSYVDEPLMMQAAGSKYYYASNHLYNVVALTDSVGSVVERYKYDAYGRQGILNQAGTVSYAPSDYGNSIGFTGRYHDWETGLVYFRARYYDAGMGRFIGRDPLGYVDGMGLYSAYFVPSSMDPYGTIHYEEAIEAHPTLNLIVAEVGLDFVGNVGLDVDAGVSKDDCPDHLASNWRPYLEFNPYWFKTDSTSGSGIKGGLGVKADPDWQIGYRFDIGANTYWDPASWWITQQAEAVMNVKIKQENGTVWSGSSQKWHKHINASWMGHSVSGDCVCIKASTNGNINARVSIYPSRVLALLSVTKYLTAVAHARALIWQGQQILDKAAEAAEEAVRLTTGSAP